MTFVDSPIFQPLSGEFKQLGNTEIIHILELQIKARPKDIFGAIRNHRRGVFDWILSNNDSKNNQKNHQGLL